MKYADQFEQDFAARTQTLLESYGGAYDATLLVNCLVGLLFIPRARSFERIPNDPVSDLSQWGVSSESISSFGERRPSDQHEPNTVRGFVQSLRNAVAYFQLAPKYKDGQASAFRYQRPKWL